MTNKIIFKSVWTKRAISVSEHIDDNGKAYREFFAVSSDNPLDKPKKIWDTRTGNIDELSHICLFEKTIILNEYRGEAPKVYVQMELDFVGDDGPYACDYE